MKLTEKQKRFCEEYLIDLNATQAAKRAGYKNTEIGRQLITKNNVLQYLSELRSKQSERTQITADKVLSELAAIAFSDRTELARVVHKQGVDPETGQPFEYAAVDMTDTNQLSDTVKKSIAGIKTGKNGIEVASYDKLRALELIGKHLGIFSDKKEDNADALSKLDEVLSKIGGD